MLTQDVFYYVEMCLLRSNNKSRSTINCELDVILYCCNLTKAFNLDLIFVRITLK